MTQTNLAPRKREGSGPRVSMYTSWSYPAEAGRELYELNNRYSAMWEVRRVAYPRYEGMAGNPQTYMQGIDGTLELFHRDWEPFREMVSDLSGHPVPYFERIDLAGHSFTIDDRMLSDVDTLLLLSLDHQLTNQSPTPEEIDAIQKWLRREGTCLILCPHHEVGASEDPAVREKEYRHHGDRLVGRQQRFGGFGRALMNGLGIPVENRFGLNPGRTADNKEPAPLSVAKDLDGPGWLQGVTTFNLHPHLPHFELTTNDEKHVKVLAKQPINTTRPHPFTEAGNREFNAFLWLPPNEKRAGDVIIADATLWGYTFGGDSSLRRLWKNLFG
jgi:hypothetical protein